VTVSAASPLLSWYFEARDWMSSERVIIVIFAKISIM